MSYSAIFHELTQNLENVRQGDWTISYKYNQMLKRKEECVVIEAHSSVVAKTTEEEERRKEFNRDGITC